MGIAYRTRGWSSTQAICRPEQSEAKFRRCESSLTLLVVKSQMPELRGACSGLQLFCRPDGQFFAEDFCVVANVHRERGVEQIVLYGSRERVRLPEFLQFVY